MNLASNILLAPILGLSANSGSAQTTALSSAYTFGSAGAVQMFRFVASKTRALAKLLFFSTASAGTASNVLVEIRNYGVSASVPGSSVLASQTCAWNGTANKWNLCTFSSPASLTQNNAYWVVISNADASPTVNFPTIQGSQVLSTSTPLLSAFTSANGGSTSTSSTGLSGTLVLVFDDGTQWGNPYTSATSYATNLLRRGLRIESLDAGLTVVGARYSTATNHSALEWYAGTGAPGSTTIRSDANNANNEASAVTQLISPLQLSANTNYRAVMTFSGTSASPGYWQIQDYSSFADVQACGFADGKIYSTIDNGSGGWTDDKSILPRIGLILGSMVSGGGSSRARVVNRE